MKIDDDTAEKLGWSIKLEDEGETFSDLIEVNIRKEVDARFAPLEKRVAIIKAARDGSAPVLANEPAEGE